MNKSTKCSSDDYQQALKFIEIITHRVSELESKAIIPSIINDILCTTDINTNTNMQAADVALACRLLHGQNAKYLLHLETILLQFGYVTASQRDEDDNESISREESLTFENEEQENAKSCYQRRSSILFESFHSDADEELTLDEGISLILNSGEPLRRLSEGDEDDMTRSLTPGKEFRRKSTLYSHNESDDENNKVENNDCDKKHITDINCDDYESPCESIEASEIFETAVDAIDNHASHLYRYSNIPDDVATINSDHHNDENKLQDESVASIGLQLDDTIGDNTAELLVSFEDEDDPTSSSDEEEESLDPTIVCDREMLAEMQAFDGNHFQSAPNLTIETPINSNYDIPQHGTSPLEKYQVQILNGGACCRVSPVANTFRDIVQSPIKVISNDAIFDIQQDSIKTDDLHARSMTSPETDESNSSKKNVPTEEALDQEVSFDESKSSALSKANSSPIIQSEVKIENKSLYSLLQSNKSKIESLVEKSLDSLVVDEKEDEDEEIEDSMEKSLGSLVDSEEEDYDSDSDTLVMIRDRRYSESSFEPSRSDETDESFPNSSDGSFESDQGILNNRNRSPKIIVAKHHSVSTESVESHTNDQSDDASVASFQSCVSDHDQHESAIETSLGNKSMNNRNKLTPTQNVLSCDSRTPTNPSKDVSVRTPLAAAWIQKYMPEQKDELLRKLSSDKKTITNEVTANKTPISVGGTVVTDVTSGQMNTPKEDSIMKLTDAEYNEAPRVIKMQVTLTELNDTINIINQWLKRQDNLLQPISMQEDIAYHILMQEFDKSKTKSLLMSLVHFRRLVMQLSSRAGGGGKRFIVLKT